MIYFQFIKWEIWKGAIQHNGIVENRSVVGPWDLRCIWLRYVASHCHRIPCEHHHISVSFFNKLYCLKEKKLEIYLYLIWIKRHKYTLYLQRHATPLIAEWRAVLLGLISTSWSSDWDRSRLELHFELYLYLRRSHQKGSGLLLFCWLKSRECVCFIFCGIKQDVLWE